MRKNLNYAQRMGRRAPDPTESKQQAGTASRLPGQGSLGSAKLTGVSWLPSLHARRLAPQPHVDSIPDNDFS